MEDLEGKARAFLALQSNRVLDITLRTRSLVSRKLAEVGGISLVCISSPSKTTFDRVGLKVFCCVFVELSFGKSSILFQS